MSRVAVVYHSGYGHTKVQAEAVVRGAAAVAGTEVKLIAVEDYEKHWSALDDADAIIFGAPTYMAGASAPFKAFLDATSARWAEQRWKDKLAAGFTNSAGHNGDKLNTLQQFALFAMQHGMVWVGPRPLARQPLEQGIAGRSQPPRRIPRRDGAIERRPGRGDRAAAVGPQDGRASRRARRSGRVALASGRNDFGAGRDPMTTAYQAIIEAMTLYFDGLYHSDTVRLGKVFHPEGAIRLRHRRDADASCHGRSTFRSWTSARRRQAATSNATIASSRSNLPAPSPRSCAPNVRSDRNSSPTF